MESVILTILIITVLLVAVGIAAYNAGYHEGRFKGYSEAMDVMEGGDNGSGKN